MPVNCENGAAAQAGEFGCNITDTVGNRLAQPSLPTNALGSQVQTFFSAVRSIAALAVRRHWSAQIVCRCFLRSEKVRWFESSLLHQEVGANRPGFAAPNNPSTI
jgi:hypothetical protein